MKKRLPPQTGTIIILLFCCMFEGCRNLQQQNEMLAEPWIGQFLEYRNVRSLGLHGPVEAVDLTEYDQIRYDSAGNLLTDTIKEDGDGVSREHYRFNRSGQITQSLENGEDYKSVHYARRSGDINQLMITSGNESGTAESNFLFLFNMQMKYKGKKLTQIHGLLTPFDIEDYYRDISLRSDISYAQQKDSNTCTENGTLHITVKPDVISTDDSLHMVHSGFYRIPGTDTFAFPFKVVYVRDRKGLLLSRTTTAAASFFGIVEPGSEKIEYSLKGKPVRRLIKDENSEESIYDDAGREIKRTRVFLDSFSETTQMVYDDAGNKMQETLTSTIAGKFRWKKVMSYRYDSRDSLSESWQTSFSLTNPKEGGDVLYRSDAYYTRYVYDAEGLLSEKIVYAQDSLLTEQDYYIYTRDRRLLRETKITIVEGKRLWSVISKEFRYDVYGNPVREYTFFNNQLFALKKRAIRYY